MTSVSIRLATHRDISYIARLHAISWKDTYANIYPNDYLENNLELERDIHWHLKFNNLNESEFILVAEERNHIISFACVLAGDENYDALVDNLHVNPDAKRKGIGTQMLINIAKELDKRGKANFSLSVLDENFQAINFYKKMHGLPKEKGFSEVAGYQIPKTRFVWNNLQELLNVKRL